MEYNTFQGLQSCILHHSAMPKLLMHYIKNNHIPENIEYGTYV